MPQDPDESIELQRELLREMQRVNDRLDMITNYEEPKPSGVFYVGCAVAIILFCVHTAKNQNSSSMELGVFYLMIIMFCLTSKSRMVSPAFQAWDREQNRKLAERIKRDNGETKESVPGLQRNIHPPF